MQDLDQRLEQGFYTNVHMIAVEYDGKLVYEKYLSGEDQSWGAPIGPRRPEGVLGNDRGVRRDSRRAC